MSSLRLHKVLDYYDGPQIIEARDPIGGHYVGVCIRDGFDGDYILVGTDPERLRQFRSGAIDLLALLAERPKGWTFGSFSESDPWLLEAGVIRDDPIPDECLPLPGFYLHESKAPDKLVERARAESSLVLAVTVEPPESIDGQRIHSDSLGRLLIGVQRLIKNAYRHYAKTPRASAIPAGHAFDVVATDWGSFQIMFQPTDRANLLGSYEGVGGLNILAELFGSSDDADRTATMIAQNYKGHLASAYRDFLDLLIAQESRFEIGWADSTASHATFRRMSLSEAQHIRTRLGVIKGVTDEVVELVGVLREANEYKDTWILEVGGERRPGQRSEDGPPVSGLTIGRSYRFTCNERIEVTGTGSEKTVLYLVAHDKLDAD